MTATITLLALLAACTIPEAEVVENDGPSATGNNTRVTLDRAKVRGDLSAIRNAIKLYKGMNEGENPTSLSQLSLSGLNYPDDYVLKDGKVSSKEFPSM